jgi:hypothetical protein
MHLGCSSLCSGSWQQQVAGAESSTLQGCVGGCTEAVLLAPSDVDVLTLGQYMRPTKRHMAVAEYVTPQAFAGFQKVRHAQARVLIPIGLGSRLFPAIHCRGAPCVRLPASTEARHAALHSAAPVNWQLR